jgi:signal transduction histidine kinase
MGFTERPNLVPMMDGIEGTPSEGSPTSRGDAARISNPIRPRDARSWRTPTARRILGRLRTRLLKFVGGIRLRLVWWFIVVLALATAGSVILVRQVLIGRLDARIQSELVQEANEIRRLAEGNDPETGEPFGPRVDRIFEVFLERNIPPEHEMLVTFVDGRLHGYSPPDEPPPLDEVHSPYPLHQDASLTALWANLEEPDRGRAETPVGTVEYLAVPFLVGGEPSGVFVVASFRDLQRADTDAASLAAAIVGLVMLVIGSALAVRLADRILAPVRLVTRTARSISDTDLSQRIPVRGYDEIAELSGTFNEMLERLEAAFGTQRRFVDDAGHELRTPITVIRGHLELMGDEPEDRRRTLALVSDELERMTRMVEDLLTLARTEQPDFLRPRVVDLDELTIRMLQNAQGMAPRDWRMEGTAEGRATIDEQRLMQAVLQLAANAIRHTADGDLVALGSATRDGFVRFWVRDTGPGVSIEDRDRIFERFYRGRSGFRRSEGAGLGLSIVQAIADAHGGRVELDSAPGQGATFTVVVPAVYHETTT